MDIKKMRYGEFLGATAVVVSLVFVAYELRQANNLAAYQAVFDLNSAINEQNLLVAENAEIAEMFLKVAGGKSELTPVETVRFETFGKAYINVWEAAWNAYNRGIIDDRSLDAYMGSACEPSSPMRDLWENVKGAFNSEFVVFLDTYCSSHEQPNQGSFSGDRENNDIEFTGCFWPKVAAHQELARLSGIAAKQPLQESLGNPYPGAKFSGLMNREKWKDLLEGIGVIAIVASLIFVAQEIRTNTESNNIAIEQNYSSNWMTINAAIAENKDLAGVLEKGLAGEELDRAEARQFDQLVSMYLTQSFHMLRLYDSGLISEAEVRAAFRAVRRLAQHGRFREEIETVSIERNRRLILDPDGFEKWLNLDEQWPLLAESSHSTAKLTRVRY